MRTPRAATPCECGNQRPKGNRYCGKCEAKVRRAMKRDHYLVPLPQELREERRAGRIPYGE